MARLKAGVLEVLWKPSKACTSCPAPRIPVPRTRMQGGPFKGYLVTIGFHNGAPLFREYCCFGFESSGAYLKTVVSHLGIVFLAGFRGI